MTKLTRQEFDNCLYQRADPAPAKAARELHGFRKFWFVWVPLGAFASFVVTLIAGSPGVFLPCWFVSSFILWGCGEGLEDKRGDE